MGSGVSAEIIRAIVIFCFSQLLLETENTEIQLERFKKGCLELVIAELPGWVKVKVST